MKNLEHIIAEHPFFKDLSPEYLELVTGCAANVRFDAGQFIHRQHEEADQFYLIRQGKVALELDPPGREPLTIETINEGEILGWAWLVPPYQWHCDAQALELTRAIRFDGKCLRTKCSSDHSLGYELLSRLLPIIGQRMEATQIQLMDIYGHQR
ncbi:MAG: cyclic nucleotide-binding domain-containing protein [Nitrospina sp.]|nr:cyclic nucleotide-binding domain-containing protein [Nitrospina sp.]